MKIEELGKISGFETMPKDASLYLSAVQYSSGLWCSGPSGMDKNEVIKQISCYSGVSAARIYEVSVPLRNIPSA